MRRALFIVAVNFSVLVSLLFLFELLDKSSRYFVLATKFCTYSLTDAWLEAGAKPTLEVGRFTLVRCRL